ncbi:MAG: stage II sporulation protein R [Clostridia bacterium]|nr:stage II sporulation protein R [Clostridia bacterium]
MKKLAVLGAVIIIVLVIILGTTYKQTSTDYLRIHIRANSNLEVDQAVKYKIKDQVVLTLTPLVANCDSFDSVKSVMANNLALIDGVANRVLRENGFSYTAKSKLCEEEFPTRAYGEFVLEAGFYDAIIVELGKAEGDNWWCVVYPPLCFVNSGAGNNVVYRSRIWDLIESWKNSH